ncbi:hypothetical protein [Paraburkholderia caffeinilytica]|uniref:hypothetical protein n=1 Tax=Paraburkholderia caffeinilytica TaxID=1761016 RepID=UPI003DA18029
MTESKDKNTPVSTGVIWKTPGAKTNAIASLKRQGYSVRSLFIIKDTESSTITRGPGRSFGWPRGTAASAASY